MAKWNLDTIEADMAEIRECVAKLEEINRLQAQTIERIQGERIEALNKNAWQAQTIARQTAEWRRVSDECEALREQLRQAQQSLRSARDSALEEAAAYFDTLAYVMSITTLADAHRQTAQTIRSLKSTTQGSRE